VIELIYRYNNIPELAHVFLSFQPETTSRTKEVEAVLDEYAHGGIKGCDINDESGQEPRAVHGQGCVRCRMRSFLTFPFALSLPLVRRDYP